MIEHISGETLIASFFILRTYKNELDVAVHGINGCFQEPQDIADFITNPNEHDFSEIKKELAEKYPSTEHDQFYWVHTSLIHISGEYGDYGQCICDPYYMIGEVLEVSVEDVDTEVMANEL